MRALLTRDELDKVAYSWNPGDRTAARVPVFILCTSSPPNNQTRRLVMTFTGAGHCYLPFYSTYMFLLFRISNNTILQTLIDLCKNIYKGILKYLHKNRKVAKSYFIFSINAIFFFENNTEKSTRKYMLRIIVLLNFYIKRSLSEDVT